MSVLFFPFLRSDHAKLRERLRDKTVLITGASYGKPDRAALRETQRAGTE